MSMHEPVKVGVAGLLVPRQRDHPARYVDPPRPLRPMRLRAVLGLPHRRSGRHRAEPMQAPTWSDLYQAIMTSVLLSGQPLDVRVWAVQQQIPAHHRHAYRPGRHAYPPSMGGPRRADTGAWRRMS
jgi:hypothetical protein